MERSGTGRLHALGVVALALTGLATLGAEACGPTFIVTRPAPSAQVPSGVVTIAFEANGYTLGDQGEPHLHFYVDSDPVTYHFYNGATREVRYQGVHTHFVHWSSPSSIDLFGLSMGNHQVRFRLAAADHSEIAPESAPVASFTVMAPPAAQFRLEPVVSGLDFPLQMAFAPDGRIFYNEWLTGNIRVIDPGFQLRPQPFYTVSNLVTGGERGLLGLALDPNFSTNHFVYVLYTTDDPLRSRLIRLTDNNSIGSAETVVRNDLPASTGNHNGGVIVFGPDKKLYVVIGDVGDLNTPQDNASMGGKMLRFNKTGTIPSDNPIAGSPVYAKGIRNSFGFTFHPHTGQLWESENGPDRDDEINRIVPNGNYGWPGLTGIQGNPCCVDPIVTFNPPIAVTGIVGISSRSIYPEEYRDNLLVADFNTGQIQRIVLTGAALDRLGSLSVAYAGGEGGLLDLEEAADGYVYVSSTSAILRMVRINGACDDGADNDGDGKIDFGSSSTNDPGCANRLPGSREDPACNDGIDNDSDGKKDFPADPDCRSASGPFEAKVGCGLGFELALVLPPLLALAARRRARIRPAARP